MTFAVGVFDLFAYTIPGSLYLGLAGYLVVRVGWVEPAELTGVPVVLLVIGAVLASYLLGYMVYPVGAGVNRLVPRLRRRRAQSEFLRRVPEARDRGYITADRQLLLAAVQIHDKDVAIEVTRLRAAGLMLRNSAAPLALASLAALVELIVGRHPGPAVAGMVVFAGAFASVMAGARRLTYWAYLKTLELGFWVPEIDEKLGGPAAPDAGA
ncbi:MAG TPA: hypothetical protein VGR06_15955 [Actinophytocola sp.]|uniref:hypothetical protein n=1 Tax=Actinophytocola sp. TaxID=1872138 RepID=UPI002E020D3D|nr:hypothetical protein [Actinophytocola sp.]